MRRLARAIPELREAQVAAEDAAAEQLEQPPLEGVSVDSDRLGWSLRLTRRPGERFHRCEHSSTNDVKFAQGAVVALAEHLGGQAADADFRRSVRSSRVLWVTGALGRSKKCFTRRSSALWLVRAGKEAAWDGLQVHHRIPLEWAHLFPNSDPNRISNLLGMIGTDHDLVTAAWRQWKRSLNGRAPSQTEVIQQALRIDKEYGDLMRCTPP